MFGRYIPGQVVEYYMEHWPSRKADFGVIHLGPFADGMWTAYEMEDGTIVREYEIKRVLVEAE